MNFNATLIGQSITFLFFVWFCMKMIWPPIMNALESRKKLIADGLAAADRGKHSLELAAKQAADNMRDAKTQAAEVLAQAEKRAAQMLTKPKRLPKKKANANWPQPKPTSRRKPTALAKACASRSRHWPYRVQKKSCVAKSIRRRTLTC